MLFLVFSLLVLPFSSVLVSFLFSFVLVSSLLLFSLDLVILLVVIFGIKSLIDENNLRKTTDYKLSEIGYTANEISLIKELKKEEIDTILKHKYNVNITKLMKEKYFIFKNLDKYLDYITESSESNLTTVVAKVNTNASMGWYKTIIDTDTSKKTSMLVNKFYKW